MGSLFAPTYSLTLGTQQWTEQVLGIEVRLEAAPLLDSLAVTFPVAAPVEAGQGDPAELTLGSGEKEELVFTGEVDSVRRTFRGIRVTALNAGGALARFRPAVTFEQLTAASVIRKLAAEVGVSTGDLDDGVELAFYAADPTRTALEHVARVAGWGGALARVSARNRLEATVIDATQAEVGLRYGREILALWQDRMPSPVESFTVAGESGAGSTSSPEALRPTTDFFGGSRPDGPSAAHRWRFEPALRTAQGAASAGAAATRLYQAGRERGNLEAFLQPDLRPGTILEVQDLPAGLPSGPLWVSGVCHRVGPRGAATRARFQKGGDAFDPLALLGSLAGALGL